MYDTTVYEILIREYASWALVNKSIGFPGSPVGARTCFYLYLGLSQLDIAVELRQRKHNLTGFKQIKAIETLLDFTMASDCNISIDTLSEGSDIETETVETSNLEELEDHYPPVPRGPLLRAQSPMGGGDNINAKAGQALSGSDDSESDFVRFHQQWTSDPEQFKRRLRNAYNSNPGPNTALPNEAKGVDYFKEFWDQALIDKLTAETNRYAQQQRLFWPPARFVAKWKPVQKEEMLAFLGLCLAMGIQKLPQRHDYCWKTNWFFETKFNEMMTRDQFDSIWQYLHLQDNSQPNPQDQLWKIRWFLDHLQCKFKELVTPEQNVTVDESMVKYKG